MLFSEGIPTIPRRGVFTGYLVGKSVQVAPTDVQYPYENVTYFVLPKLRVIPRISSLIKIKRDLQRFITSDRYTMKNIINKNLMILIWYHECY